MTDTQNESHRYRGFISYSQADKARARRLHRALEAYRVPKGVQATLSRNRKLGRFFRDDEEMGAATDLGTALRGAIEDAESLIVVCSPRAARSDWVNEEVIHFKRTGRNDLIFAVIVDGVPNSGDPETESFPPALRFEVTRDGTITDQPAEPFGVDWRNESTPRLRARLAAGLLDVPFDSLWRRDQRRRRARVAQAAFASIVVLAIFGWIFQSFEVRSMRTAMTDQAIFHRTTARSSDASAFALAGLPPPGSPLTFMHPAANLELWNLPISVVEIVQLGDLMSLGDSLNESNIQLKSGKLFTHGSTYEIFNIESGERTELGDLGNFEQLDLDLGLLLVSFQGLKSLYFLDTGEHLELDAFYISSAEFVAGLLLIETSHGSSLAYNLETGERLDLDHWQLNERALVTQSLSGEGTLYNLESGELRELGHLAALWLVEDVLVTKSPDGQGAIYDLETDRRLDLGDLGDVYNFRFSDGMMVTQSSEGQSVLYNLETGNRLDLGVLKKLRHPFEGASWGFAASIFFWQDGYGQFGLYNLETHKRVDLTRWRLNDHALVTLGLDGQGALYDLETGERRDLGNLGDVVHWEVGDGALVTRDSKGLYTAYFLEIGKHVDLGDIMSYTIIRGVLVTVGYSAQGALYNLETGQRSDQDIQKYLVNRRVNGHTQEDVLVTRSSVGQGMLYKLESGDVLDLGDLGDITYCQFDTGMLFTQSSAGASALYNVETGERRELDPDVKEWSIDAGVLLTKTSEGQGAFYLRTGERHELGDVETWAQGEDMLFTQSPDGPSALYNLGTGQRWDLGYVVDWRFDSDVLVTRIHDGRGVLYRLQSKLTPANSVPEGTSLRAFVCDVNGSEIPPFGLEYRDPERFRDNRREDSASRTIFDKIRGRPWNPCDWEGILTTEGRAQYFRMRRVRAGDEPDYNCDEINAAGDTHARRTEICRNFGLPVKADRVRTGDLSDDMH